MIYNRTYRITYYLLITSSWSRVTCVLVYAQAYFSRFFSTVFRLERLARSLSDLTQDAMIFRDRAGYAEGSGRWQTVLPPLCHTPISP